MSASIVTYERSTLVNSEKYIGLDVHQATIVVAVMDSTGKVVMESILETKAATILEFLAGLRGTLSVTFEEAFDTPLLGHNLLVANHDKDFGVSHYCKYSASMLPISTKVSQTRSILTKRKNLIARNQQIARLGACPDTTHATPDHAGFRARARAHFRVNAFDCLH